jgi:hypothetical protein
MILISLLSMIGSIFVATMIFSSSKLQVHPQRLIAYTCVSEAISSFNGVIWSIGTRNMIEYLDMGSLFELTVLYRNEESSNIGLDTLEYSNDFFFQYFSLLTLALNTCLCIDLILTLKNPFQPAKNRMLIYLAASIVTCIPLTFLTKDSISIIENDQTISDR